MRGPSRRAFERATLGATRHGTDAAALGEGHMTIELKLLVWSAALAFIQMAC
jgi:hypothetical protein